MIFFLLRPFCLSERRDLLAVNPASLWMHKKKASLIFFFLRPFCLSERRDLNPRPLEPHSSALPGCATFRKYYFTLSNSSSKNFFTSMISLRSLSSFILGAFAGTDINSNCSPVSTSGFQFLSTCFAPSIV